MNNKSNVVKWNRANIERLISLLQSQRCLWDMKMLEYKQRSKREKAYDVICKGMRTHIKNITKEEVRSKIGVLRNQFRKQLRQIKIDKRPPTLWCYKMIYFLKPYVEIRDTDQFKIDDTSPRPDSEEEDQPEDTNAPKHWDRDGTEHLIELLYDHRCLWDKEMAKAAKYGFRTVREKALNQLCQDLQQKYNMQNVTVEDVRNKIFVLRSQYRKEIRKMEVSRRRGAQKIKPPTLWCFDKLFPMFSEPNDFTFDMAVDADVIKTERASQSPESDRQLNNKTRRQEHLSSSEDQSDEELETKPAKHFESNINWDRQITETLIKQFHQHRNLWDVKMEEYNFKTQRAASFNAISKKLQAEGKKVTAAEVRKKILSLRSQYRKQVRQLKLNKWNGGESKKPTLWCYKLLDFLRPVTVTEPVKNLTKNESSTQNQALCEDPLSFDESESEITEDTQENVYAISDEDYEITPATIEEELLEHTSPIAERLLDDTPPIEEHLLDSTPPPEEHLLVITPPIEEELLHDNDEENLVATPPVQEEISVIATTSSTNEKNKVPYKELEEHLKDLKKLLIKPKRKFDFLAEQVSATLEEIDNEEIADYTVGAIQRLLLEAKAKKYRQTNESEFQNDEEFFLV